jgi:hypothetical protein
MGGWNLRDARDRVVVESTPLKGAVSITPIECPRCGDQPDPEGGTGYLARCRSCGVLGRIHFSESLTRLIALPVHSADSLIAARMPDRAGHQVEHELLMVPFWKIDSILVGKLSGERQRNSRSLERHVDDQGVTSYRFVDKPGEIEAVERDVQRLHTCWISACPLTEQGVPLLDASRQSLGGLGLALAQSDRVALRVFSDRIRRQASVLDPLVSREVALTQADQLIAGVQRGLIAPLLPGAMARTELLDRQVTLIYWPLLQIRDRQDETLPLIDMIQGTDVGAIGNVPQSSRSLERRLFGLLAIACGLFSGGLARLALFPPVWLAGSDHFSSRWRILVGALGTAAIAGTALTRLTKTSQLRRS